MFKKVLFVAIVILMTIALATNQSFAQLGKLRDKLAKAKGEDEKSKVRDKPPALKYDTPIPTSVYYSSFMNIFEFLPFGGVVLDGINISFLPTTDVNGVKVDYKNPARLHAMMLKGEEKICDHYYTPYEEFRTYSRFGISYANNTMYLFASITEGEYQLQFALDDSVFQTIPVSC